MAGLIPWSITDWDVEAPLLGWVWLRWVGGAMIAAGAGALITAFGRFVVEGLGTPAPVAPPERLVVHGPYRYVRNPMYLAVESTILGQALLFGQQALFAYAALLAGIFLSFVRLYEEPTLAKRFGSEYEAYRRAVPGWVPRLTPWQGGSNG